MQKISEEIKMKKIGIVIDYKKLYDEQELARNKVNQCVRENSRWSIGNMLDVIVPRASMEDLRKELGLTHEEIMKKSVNAAFKEN